MKKLRIAIVLTYFPFIAVLARAEDIATLQRQAVELYQAGQYQAAIPLYRQLVDLQPDKPEPLKDLLIVLWLGGRYHDSAEVGSELTGLSKNDFEAWFIYARSLLAIGKKEEALSAFKRCRELSPNEQHVRLSQARVEGLLREYETALGHLQSLQKQYPDYKEVYPELARLQQMMGDYAAAAATWARAVEFFPDKRDYKFYEAESLYYSGHRDSASAMLKDLARGTPRYWPAIDFLTDAALARGDLSAARNLLESNLTTLQSDDESRLLKLAHIQQKQENWKAVIATADRWLRMNPRSGAARMLKADALKHLDRNQEAVQVYQQILEANPAISDAWVGMAQAENEDGDPGKAVEAIKKAEALDPTDPYLLIYQSYYLFETGDTQVHKEILESWIKSHPEPALPALLYHGVTPYPQDPILGYSIHRSTANLEDQMRALHEARFTPVTADQVNAWIQGKSKLPDRAFFLTFDDARLDSFQYADPILKKYDFKAAMFAPLVDVEGYIPKTASWKDLERYRDTGRWDIQSHGDLAHERIPVDDQGHRGLFLLNKEWLEKAHRMETDDEWADRVRRDHESSQQKIDRHLGYTPRAYSFPEGDFGQGDVSNSPRAADLNLKWARDYFTAAYHEDNYGFNVDTRDPMRLTRYEPPADQTGTALVRHLTDQSPGTLMVRRLLREAAWSDRYQEADQWLTELKKRGVSSSALWAEEARILAAEGDRESALALAEKALREDDSEENRELVHEIKQMTRWVWTGGFTYQEDNQSRINRQFRQDFGFFKLAGMELSLHQFTGSYSESGVQTVMEEGGGVVLAKKLNDSQQLSLDASGHFLSASADSTYTLGGELDSAWARNVSTVLQGGRDLYYFGRALDANVIDHFVDGQLRWRPESDWRASGRVRLEDLSDDNQRATEILEGGRRLFLPRLWMVARATWDTTERVSPNYYSPQLLQEYQLGADYTLTLGKGSSLNVVYLPGYGKEKTSDGEFVNDIDAVLNLALTSSLTLSPSVSLIRQPTYHRNTYNATLTYRF